MDIKCTGCNTYWNVSVFANLSRPYLCPECRAKRKVDAIKRRGRVPNVLHRNQIKYKERVCR